MKSLVTGLSTVVRRFPWVVVIVTVIVSVVLGGLSQNFTPEEDSNAPDAPELTAAESISDLFGSESTVAVMQVIITADDGNIFSLDGLETINALSETVAGGGVQRRSRRPGWRPDLHIPCPGPGRYR